MNFKIFKILLPFIIQFKKYLIILSVTFLFEVIAAFIVIVSIAPLVEYTLDSSLSNPSFLTKIILEYLLIIDFEPSFWTFVSIFIAGNFLKASLDIITRFICLKIKANLFISMSYKNLNAIFKSNWLFFGRSDPGKLMNVFQKEHSNIAETVSQLAQQTSYFFQLIIYFSIPLWIDFYLTIIAIGIAIIFMLPFLLLHRFSYSLGDKNTKTSNIMIGTLHELFQSIRLIISHNKQNISVNEYIKTVKMHAKASVNSQLFVGGTGIFFQPFTMLAALIAIGVSNTLNADLPETAAVLWGLMRAMPILSKILQSNLNITHLIPSITHINKIVLKAKQTESKSGIKKIDSIKKSILFSDVSFLYKKKKFNLKNINLNIEANKFTALAGVSGSGKSTIIDLVLGLQEPQKGTLLVDNIPYGNIDLNNFREKIGYIPQDSPLFNLSIRENLVWFQKNITELEMIEACETANAMEFIQTLPNGFDTIVGNRGTNLSGGQRQRITFARALLRKPALLILDEATNSLDTKSENLIYKALEKLHGKMTVILVSHKLQSLKCADIIYVLNNGEIVQKGNFNSLIKNENEKFYNMINNQL